jgi:hypothetical protein
LARDGRLGRQTLRGRQLVYLARDPQQAKRQHQQRQQRLEQARGTELPEGCSAAEVIEVLRQMVISPEESPDQLARKLKSRDVRVTAGQVRQVMDYCALEKKRQAWP